MYSRLCMQKSRQHPAPTCRCAFCSVPPFCVSRRLALDELADLLFILLVNGYSQKPQLFDGTQDIDAISLSVRLDDVLPRIFIDPVRISGRLQSAFAIHAMSTRLPVAHCPDLPFLESTRRRTPQIVMLAWNAFLRDPSGHIFLHHPYDPTLRGPLALSRSGYDESAISTAVRVQIAPDSAAPDRPRRRSQTHTRRARRVSGPDRCNRMGRGSRCTSGGTLHPDRHSH